MADYYVDEKRDYNRSRGSNWAWLLLLPLFFLGGWLMNDALEPGTSNGPQAGVGGAPFEDDRDTTVSPSLREDTDTTTISPSPRVTDGLDYEASGDAE
jgi:hypothetical protein